MLRKLAFLSLFCLLFVYFFVVLFFVPSTNLLNLLSAYCVPSAGDGEVTKINVSAYRELTFYDQ